MNETTLMNVAYALLYLLNPGYLKYIAVSWVKSMSVTW